MPARDILFQILLAITLSSAIYAAPAPAPNLAVQTPADAQTASPLKQEPEDLKPWPREPFKKIEDTKNPLQQQNKVAGSDDLSLQGIMKIDRHYYAIINGRTVKPGDHVAGWTVSAITKHRVTFHREKELQTLDIYQGRINRGIQ